MNQKYQIYFITKQYRIEAMMLCSFASRIDWVNNGLKIVSWEYQKGPLAFEKSLSDVYNNYKKISFNKKNKAVVRGINVGDVICLENEAWIITTCGFAKIPNILWDKIIKKI